MTDYQTVFSLCVLLFCAGLIEDLFQTWTTVCVVRGQAVVAGLINFIYVIIVCAVILSVVANLDKWYVILAYALGSGVGAGLMVKYQKPKPKKVKRRRRVK